MKKLGLYGLSSLFVVGVGIAVLECSGVVCGDGVMAGSEQCDKAAMNGQPGSGCSADCKVVNIPVASLQVSFDMFRAEALGFSKSTCADTGVAKWHLELQGPSADDKMLDCIQPSQSYPSVIPGTYQATITLFDALGNVMTKAVQTMAMDVQINQPTVQLYYNFRPDDFFRQDYTGVLYWNASWGATGARCATASPMVIRESVRLYKAGVLVPGMTADGLNLDGTFGSCPPPAAGSERVMGMLPWGHYDLVLEGEATGAPGSYVAYCEKFDVFVAPGSATGIYALTVDPAPADGGACP